MFLSLSFKKQKLLNNDEWRHDFIFLKKIYQFEIFIFYNVISKYFFKQIFNFY